jgi:hypothetical protein
MVVVVVVTMVVMAVVMGLSNLELFIELPAGRRGSVGTRCVRRRSLGVVVVVVVTMVVMAVVVGLPGLE